VKPDRDTIGLVGGVLILVALFEGEQRGPYSWIFLAGWLLVTFAAVAARIERRRRRGR
jgi:hypothetical protein